MDISKETMSSRHNRAGTSMNYWDWESLHRFKTDKIPAPRRGRRHKVSHLQFPARRRQISFTEHIFHFVLELLDLCLFLFLFVLFWEGNNMKLGGWRGGKNLGERSVNVKEYGQMYYLKNLNKNSLLKIKHWFFSYCFRGFESIRAEQRHGGQKTDSSHLGPQAGSKERHWEWC